MEREKFGVKRYHPELAPNGKKFLVYSYDELPGEDELWFDDEAKFPKPFNLISEEEWAICDRKLGERYGLSKNSFKKDVIRAPNTKKVNPETDELYSKVIAEYGDRIELVDMGNYKIYRWKDGECNDNS
jgi:hypothetical protein